MMALLCCLVLSVVCSRICGAASPIHESYWHSMKYLIKGNLSDAETLARRMLDEESTSFCGARNVSAITRIVGGKKAPKGAWPWVVALGYSDTPGHAAYQCGGVLVAPDVVLTAAHCVHERPDLYTVRIGNNDLASKQGVDLPIVASIVHAAYQADSNENDIALLKLKSSAPISRFVQAICLPDINQYPLENTTRAWIAGWGSTSYRGPSSRDQMQLSLNVLDKDKCRKAYEMFGKSAVVDERVLCAGADVPGKDACQGDSGGPLMWEDANGIFHVLGIISYGYKCAEPDFPGVYTSIHAFLPWVQRHLRHLRTS